MRKFSRGILNALTPAAGRLLDLVYPHDCIACGAALHDPDATFLCAPCKTKLHLIDKWQCPRCGEELGPHAQSSRKACPSCRDRAGLMFRGAVASCRYEGSAREMVLRLKYGSDTRAVAWMGERLAEKVLESRWFPKVDFIVPVPLHWTRRLRRRFNQAELLSGILSRRCRKPVNVRLLKRRKATSAQASLNSAERMANVRNAFSTKPSPDAHGRTVLLVDDVMTTCATASACTRTLLRAGVRRVYVAVFAR